MSNDITLKPKIQTDKPEFDDYIKDIEINFKTNKGNFIGTFNSWNISLNLNTNNIEIPESIKPNFRINEKNLKMPTFLLNPVSDEETTEDVGIKGYDKSILFDTPFEWTQLLPCTVGELTQNICDKVGVPLKSNNFANSDFVIYRQIADNKRTNREIIAMIAATAGGNAFINENDELEIRSFVEVDLDIQEYFLSEKFVKIGPITGVNLAREPIKDYKELNDSALSAQYKSCMVKITNNLIVDDNRELALQPIYNELHGLEFYCKKIETHEAYFVKPFSFVQCAGNKVLVDTICIKYPTLLDSYISSNQLTEVEITANEKSKDLKRRIINAEAKVDEVEGKINLLASEVSDYNNKISGLEVNVDEIKTKVENVADLTREVSGATKIQLDNCMQGELLELHIYGNNTVFERVFPSNNLYPSKTLYPRSYGKIAINKINLKSDIQPVIANLDIVNHQYNTGLQFCRSLIIPISEKGKKYTIFKKAGARFAVGTFDEEPAQGIIATNYISDENEGNGLTKLELTSTDNDKFLVVFFYDAYNDSESLATLYNSIEIYADYQEIELTQIKRGLRQFEDVCDELVLINNKLQVIRRIGVDNENNKYILENEKIEDLGELQIELSEGTNYIEILNYVANMQAKYVVRNEFTSKFATTVELKSAITQLADSINLTLNKKINEEDIIAALNLAILKESDAEIPEEIEKSIIQIFADILEIATTYFKLNRQGKMTCTAGEIGGWEITESSLKKGLAGLNAVSEDEVQSFKYVIFVGDGLGKDGEPSFAVNTIGDIRGNSINLYALSEADKYPSNIRLYSAAEQVGTEITASKISTYNVIAGDGGVSGHCMHGRDGENGHIYTVTWTQDRAGEPYYLAFWVDNQFVAFLENDTSDRRLKKDIENIDERILSAINAIELKQFKLKDEETIKFGVIAQEIVEIFEKNGLDFKNYELVFQKQKYMDDNTLYYFVNYEQLLLLKTKCFENINRKQQKQIDFFINKLNCQKEIEEYMKGDN